MTLTDSFTSITIIHLNQKNASRHEEVSLEA